MEEKTQESGNYRKDDSVFLWKIYCLQKFLFPEKFINNLRVLFLSLTNLYLHPKENYPFQYKSSDLEWCKILIPIQQGHFLVKQF